MRHSLPISLQTLPTPGCLDENAVSFLSSSNNDSGKSSQCAPCWRAHLHLCIAHEPRGDVLEKKQGHTQSYTVLLSNDKIGFCYGLVVDWDRVHLGIQEERRWKTKGQMPLGCFGLILLFSRPSSQRTLRTYLPHPFRTCSSSLLEQRLWDG